MVTSNTRQDESNSDTSEAEWELLEFAGSIPGLEQVPEGPEDAKVLRGWHCERANFCTGYFNFEATQRKLDAHCTIPSHQGPGGRKCKMDRTTCSSMLVLWLFVLV
eukprot:6435530-Amphidinium_carterae.1